MTRITAMKIEPYSIEREETFEFALGEISVADNFIVKIKTENGVQGIGEGAPFLPGTGENQDSAMAVLSELKNAVIGKEIENYRQLVNKLREFAPHNPTALYAVETAILDSYCRSKEIPLSELFGGKPDTLKTAVTVSIDSPEKMVERARKAERKGCETIKLKAEGEIQKDVERIDMVSEAIEADILVDANQSFSPKDAVRFLEVLEVKNISPELMEQPVSSTDFSGMRFVRENSNIPIAVDESVFKPEDAQRVVAEKAADIINIKAGKSGLIGASEIASIASSADLGLMMGCMSESAIGIQAAGHFVAGNGGFTYLDLDGVIRSPLKLDKNSLSPEIDLEGPGHGIELKNNLGDV